MELTLISKRSTRRELVRVSASKQARVSLLQWSHDQYVDPPGSRPPRICCSSSERCSSHAATYSKSKLTLSNVLPMDGSQPPLQRRAALPKCSRCVLSVTYVQFAEITLTRLRLCWRPDVTQARGLRRPKLSEVGRFRDAVLVAQLRRLQACTSFFQNPYDFLFG